MLLPMLLALASAGATAPPATVSAPTAGAEFITLGTQGGPLPSAERSQPANVLVRGDDAYLVDAGDGTVQRLTGAGIRLNRVRAVFLSHLHWDHVAGLQAVLGLRYQTNAPGVLAVYGPPGTQRLVDGLVASMQPGSEAGYGIPGARRTPPEDTVRVVELRDGGRVELPGIVVTAAENSHYSFAPGSPEAERSKSLSLRFDVAGRSIVYTGDTGPSANVERLAAGADLLVSEMIDLAATIENVARNSPNMPAPQREAMVRHLAGHHLSPVQVGELASRAGVGRLVITHIVPGVMTGEQEAGYRQAIARSYRGPVEFADDLDRF
jgi:ribonuclease BN (tRNA processing enzyme)